MDPFERLLEFLGDLEFGMIRNPSGIRFTALRR